MIPSPLSFHIHAQEGQARAGVLRTRRSVIETPVFMPVGTLGTVKGVRFEALESDELDARIILANTYHLWLRPGADVIRQCGGLHRFESWGRSLLTDSGGFQVWSLGALRKITEAGVAFRSHIDGRACFLSPEVSMEVQAALGSDIVMMFDECAPGQADHETARTSMDLTLRWGARSRVRFDELQREEQDAGRVGRDEGGGMRDETRTDSLSSSLIPPPSSLRLSGAQGLFGIVQGATHMDLRKESLARTVEIGFDGYALGGLSVGEEKQVMYDVIEEVAPMMPSERPRYLMGVGTPEDLLEGVARGIDMFDCVLPTRNARSGQVWTAGGKLNIKNARFITDTRPLDETCLCSVCRRHTRAYLRHLYVTGEMLASILLTHHNLFYFLDIMRRARQAIALNEFHRFRHETLDMMSAGV
jgi:queuine tRNA-ribosyltransferase